MDTLKLIPEGSLQDWQKIGQGGFGILFRARHTRWNFDVAVKKLTGDVSCELKELLSEAHKMDKASSSPFVITLFGILKEDSGEKFKGIVMEYMENRCLATLIYCIRPIPWALKFRIIHQVALGMNWLHSLVPPLLHLDLKPQNVLLTNNMEVKITDFGLSQFIHSGLGSDENGGTVEYMPPEAFAKDYRPSKFTDVYSFAVLTAVVLKGEDPYPDVPSVLLRYRVRQGDRPDFKSLDSEQLVKSLKEAIQFTKCCWQQNFTERPSFDECCKQWEKLYLPHKEQIVDAVRQVQDKMVRGSSKTTNTVTASSINMTEAIEKFQTLHFTEQMPAMQMAQPVSNSPMKTQQRQSHSGLKTAHPGSKVGGRNAYPQFHKTDYPHYYTNNASPTANFSKPLSSGTNITISGAASGVQIGHNNHMVIHKTLIPKQHNWRRGATVYSVPKSNPQQQESRQIPANQISTPGATVTGISQQQVRSRQIPANQISTPQAAKTGISQQQDTSYTGSKVKSPNNTQKPYPPQGSY